MSDRQMVWVDFPRCTGCGACIEVCPVEAITLVNDKAHIDHGICTGCEACINICPEDALQPVVQGELVPVRERPVPAVRRPSPVAETAGAAVVATGVGLLAKAAGALVRAVGQWLTQPSAEAAPSATRTPSVAQGKGGTREGRQGRQARHRRRGR
jgi:Pyruvate/2-oxoacid:ferredoxin oxidoreductase delta subunit